jgi:peptide deformylase
MAKILMWNLSRLHAKSRPLTGPLPDLYLRELVRVVEESQGVYISGIQVADARRFAIPNPRFKDFPILYNPSIVEQYDLVKSEGEGCLSFPGLWVQVPRYKYITITYRDGQWQERKATFGSDDPNSEEGLLAKAIQHEIFHMDGTVVHERIRDFKARIKAQAFILNNSKNQNFNQGVPQLVEGPLELDPSNLPVLSVSPSHDSSKKDLEEVSAEVPAEVKCEMPNQEDITGDSTALQVSAGSGLSGTPSVVISDGLTNIEEETNDNGGEG